eukprot:13327890-Heterocapsa_arctica.AAC.1
MDDAEREIQRGLKRARDHEAIEDYLEEYTGRLRDFEEESKIEGDADIVMVATIAVHPGTIPGLARCWTRRR